MRLRDKGEIDRAFFRRMATPERVRACMEAGLNSLKFSFNFADAAQFAQVTGVRATFP